MKENSLQVFSYEGSNIRAVEKNGEPWFVAKDVCDILGLSDVSMATRNLDDDEKGTSKVGTLRGNQDMTVITESGVYALVFKSRKPEAKEFSRWVRREVLPQIRKNGVYIPDKALEDPVFVQGLIERLAAVQEANDELRAQIAADQAATTYGKIMLGMPASLTFQESAQVLAQHGLPVGQNKLYKRCRDDKLLCSRKGRQWNKPTQKAIEAGLLSIQGTYGGYITVKITPKGLAKLADELTREYQPIIYLIDRAEMKAQGRNNRSHSGK